MTPQQLYERERTITEGLAAVYGRAVADAARIAFIYRHFGAAQLYIGNQEGRKLYTPPNLEEALAVSAAIAREGDLALAKVLQVDPRSLIKAIDFYRELAHDCWA